jgi:hypothetical protein
VKASFRKKTYLADTVEFRRRSGQIADKLAFGSPTLDSDQYLGPKVGFAKKKFYIFDANYLFKNFFTNFYTTFKFKN